MFNPHDIDKAITSMKEENEINIVNLMNKVTNEEDFVDSKLYGDLLRGFWKKPT